MAESSIVNSPAGDSAPTPPRPQAGSGKLRTRLGIAGKGLTSDSVLVSFTVINPTDSALRFCRWETPFEPKLGKYLEVVSEQGTQAAFKGAMARRVMPPPDESYITVAAHDSVRTVINLPDNYSISTGQYTIRYTGGGVSGLEAGNEIRIKVGRP